MLLIVAFQAGLSHLLQFLQLSRLYRVRDGKVIESRMFQDTAAIRDLLVEGQQQTG